MPDFHDSYVQFLSGTVIAVITILVSVILALWIYRKQKNKKELSYTLVSSAPIVSVKPDVADRIKIYLDGNAVAQAQLAVFSIKNTGNLAVKREDYDEPIVVEFPACKILDANILSTHPIDLLKPENRKTFFKWQDSTLTLAACLLNRKEELQFSVLVEGAKVEPKVRARIVDGALIEEKPALWNNIVLVLSSVVVLIGGILAISAILLNLPIILFSIMVPYGAAMIVITLRIYSLIIDRGLKQDSIHPSL